MTDNASTELRALLGQLVEKTNKLIPTIIEKTGASDKRSRLQKAGSAERHRLCVLLEAARKAQQTLPRSVTNPWFLAEFVATVEVIRRWHDKPVWKAIEPALVSPDHFPHTIAKLHLAEQLQQLGHSVEIVPRCEDASPDLRVQAFGKGDYFNIECYQPRKLVDKQEISLKELEKIVDHSMEKAKRQLIETAPGILAVCGFNQPKLTLSTLKRIVARRLQQTDRPSLCGILTAFFSILYESGKGARMFTPIVSIDFVPNPSYFGRLSIGEEEAKDHPRLIKKSLTYISSDDLLSRKPRQVQTGRSDVVESVPAWVRSERVKVIQEPVCTSRAVVSSKGTLPLFKGEANINYLCGQCGTMLAERAWKLSLINIVVKCPSCQSFNEFPVREQLKLPIFGSVALAKGSYDFTDPVILRRGTCLVGR